MLDLAGVTCAYQSMNKRASLLIVSVVLATSVYLANAQFSQPPASDDGIGRYKLLNGHIGMNEVTFRMDSVSGETVVIGERADPSTGVMKPAMNPVLETPEKEEMQKFIRENPAAYLKALEDAEPKGFFERGALGGGK